MLHHAVDIGAGDDVGAPLQGRLARFQGSLHQRRLAQVVILVERRQQAGAGAEVVIDHRLGHPGLLGQASEGQRLGTFFADQPPGHLEQLALALVAGQAAAWRRVVWGVH